MYLVYDVRGIQKYIFAVPKLKSIVGGSLLIDEFDSITTPHLAKDFGQKMIYTGGGRGLFQSSNTENLGKFKAELVFQAHKLGLDLRLGEGPEEKGIPEAKDLYPFQPEIKKDVVQFPCSLSGLWPVDGKKPHEIIDKREKKAGELILDRLSESKIKKVLWHLNDVFATKASEILEKDVTLVFFRNVTASSAEENKEADASAAALGNRNRWAVVCMDGNDMGLQIKKTMEMKSAPEITQNWFHEFSGSLSKCTQEAFQAALTKVVGQWLEDEKENLKEFCFQKDYLVLPFRPLILGGDDVTILCHGSYAMAFAEQMSREFEEISSKKAAEFPGLWPATNGKLTISAGVLFCKTTFPLAMAIEYADALLANAKGSFRTKKKEGEPTPAAVDWETVTETLVDSPTERRRREMYFHDSDLGGLEIHLTQKPYKLEDLKDLYKTEMNELLELPRSLRSGFLKALHQPWSLRAMFLASIGKRHTKLMVNLAENPDEPQRTGRWWTNEGKVRKTRIIDAITLLDEQTRMTQNTVEK